MVWFLTEWRANLRAPIVLIAWAFVTLLLALSGPFGSYAQIPFLERFLLWGSLAALALVVASALRTLVYGHLGMDDYWRGSSLTAGLVAMVLSYPVLRVTQAISHGAGYMPPSFAEIWGFVFCLSMGFCAFRRAAEGGAVALEGGSTFAPTAGPDQMHAPEPRLMARLEADLRGVPVRVAVRDHYVDVVTDKGTGSVLMRFSDAIAELDGVDGLRVHRSHWVAAHAVVAVERGEAKVMLRLIDGVRVPVSRSYRDTVDARWPDQA